MYRAGGRNIIVNTAKAVKLCELDVELVALSVSAQHFHALARFTPAAVDVTTVDESAGMAMPGLCAGNALRDGRDSVPRHALGIARKHASFALREAGCDIDGGIWAARPRCEPIKNRLYQVNTTWYGLDHVQEGAAVWARPALLTRIGNRLRGHDLCLRLSLRSKCRKFYVTRLTHCLTCLGLSRKQEHITKRNVLMPCRFEVACR